MAKDTKDKNTVDLVDSDKTIYTAGQALAAKRKKVDKPCAVCGDMMLSVYETKKTCSDSCRQKKSRNPDKYD